MLRRELLPAIAGVAIGLAVAFLAAPVVVGTPFETNPRDPLTYAGVAEALLATALIATYLPIRRAGATSPAEALHG